MAEIHHIHARARTHQWTTADKIQKGDHIVIGRTKVKITMAKKFGFNQMSLQGLDVNAETYFITVPFTAEFPVRIKEKE